MVTVNERHHERRRTAAQWTAENPTLAAGEIGVVLGSGPPLDFKIGDGVTDWNTLPYLPDLAVADPAELSLSTVGSVSTLGVLDTIARAVLNHRSGDYYLNVYDTTTTPTMTQNTLYYFPVILSAGTVDRIGGEVTTGIASGVLRCGIYADNDGLPGTLIAEASTTGDASTASAKDLTISAAITKNGVYWLAAVIQGAAGVIMRGCTRGIVVPLGVGTTLPTGTVTWMSRTQTGITGALPGSAAVAVNASSQLLRMHYRYA